MIQKSKILSAQLQVKPYPHALIENFINPEDFRLLLENFPQEGFLLSKRKSGSDKTYTVDNNIIFGLELQQKNPLILNYPYWCALVDELTSKDYKQLISNFLGVNLQDLPIELTLKRYKKSHYISPHTDRDYVNATHLIFFNEVWNKNWGGELCIMSSSRKIEKKILPLWEKSLLFLRTDNSWHAVTKCNAPVPRIVLQVAFWRTNKRCLPKGRTDIPY
jgi:Rps23 Pro-64 3,4-dihydroxylase Tpa1-like proline 4-hydroxylase